MDALLRYFYFFWWTTEHGVRKVERCMAKLARAPHTHITMTLLGRSAGTACWLAGVVEGLLRNFAYSRQLSQARPRTASTSLTLRSLHVKAQLRLAGDRRKLGRNGFSWLTSSTDVKGATSRALRLRQFS